MFVDDDSTLALRYAIITIGILFDYEVVV